MSKQDTAVEWFMKELFTEHSLTQQLIDTFEHAKELEKQQHSETWDKALKQLENRGHVYSRAFADFDDYFNETFNK